MLDYAARAGWPKPRFYEEKVSGRVHWRKRKLGRVIDSLKPGDVLIVPELSRLGRSLIEVLEVLQEAKAKAARVFSVKEGFQLNGDDMTSKIMSTLLALFSELERDLIALRVREGVRSAMQKPGSTWGRPVGSSRLVPFKDAIINDYLGGASLAALAERYQAGATTVSYFLRQAGVLLRPPRRPRRLAHPRPTT